MNNVQWIKIATNIFDNRKIKQIEAMPEGYTIIVIWLKLLCLAGSINDYGSIYFTNEIPYTEQTLATQFNISVAKIQLALMTFEQFGMIEIVNDVLRISNWEKYQNIEGMEKIREQNRVRQKQWYDRQKTLPNVTPNVSLTQPNATDKEEEIDIDKDINKERAKPKRFVPPSLSEVKAYCQSRNNGINPQNFIDFYESKGWMVGNNKMKDWKAAVRTWENRRKDERNGSSNQAPEETGEHYGLKL